jgi:hypothetical protein
MTSPAVARSHGSKPDQPDVRSSTGSTKVMSEFKPRGELHLRLAGHTAEWTLLLVDDPPNEDEVASWMQEGMVARIRVAEQGSNEPYVMLVNFSLVVAARVLSAPPSDRGVRF